LPVVDEAGLRPTPERVRETLFNWLAPNIEGRRCLDLFAGSGALGLEALSRGASSVIFVEKSPAAAKMLGDNIARLDAGGASLRYDDALQFVQSAAAGPFDIVFLDPPFAEDLLEDLCRLLAGSGMLAPGARVYLEQERRQARAELPAGWQIEKENSAGNVRYSLAVVDT
jgi:16S rRNA (guanine966-N2)-methyltransferase